MSDLLHIRKAAALLPPLLLAWLLILPGYARAAVVVAVVAAQPEVPVAEVLDGFRHQFTAAGEDLDLRVYPLPDDTLEIAGQIARIQASPPN